MRARDREAERGERREREQRRETYRRQERAGATDARTSRFVKVIACRTGRRSSQR